MVTYEIAASDLTDEARDALTAATDQAREGALTVEAGGDAVMVEQTMTGTGEQIGVLISAVVLFLTFGSLIAAGMPLLTALIGVAVGTSAIAALGSALGLSATTGTLAMMIGLAVGIDYTLFVVSRYRAEITEGRVPRRQRVLRPARPVRPSSSPGSRSSSRWPASWSSTFRSSPRWASPRRVRSPSPC